MTSATQGISLEAPAKKAATFERPPFAKEVFNKEFRELFDKHPGANRHFIRQFLLTGNIKLAAKQAGLTGVPETEINEKKSVSRVLDENGLGVNHLIGYLHDCVKAETMIRDKHGNVSEGIDLKVRLSAIEMLLKIHGAFDRSRAQVVEGVLDMFEGLDPKAKG